MLSRPLERCLLDYDDGTCRDVNFLAPTWIGVQSLLEQVRTEYTPCEVTDGDGSLVSDYSAENLSSITSASPIIVVLSGGNEVLTGAQIFIESEDDGSPFVELTFFPDLLVKSPKLGDEFIAYIQRISDYLQSTRFYCRYENAGWKFGDMGRYSGVFLDSDAL